MADKMDILTGKLPVTGLLPGCGGYPGTATRSAGGAGGPADIESGTVIIFTLIKFRTR